MDIYDSLFSPGSMLSEQIARQLFQTLPDGGPVMIILDRDGNFWPSDSEKFSSLNISEPFLRELCAKIDDGDEPIVTQFDDCSIVAGQLVTEQTNCGYIVLTLPQYTPESALINIDLIEMLLSQINLIARLIETNQKMYELQVRHFTGLSHNETALN